MTGQTMISAAFFVMLTVAVLSANRMVLESNKDYIQAQAVEQATNLANALISEILTKKFDMYVSSTENIIPPAQDTTFAQIKNWMKTTYLLDSTNYRNPSTFTDPTALGAAAADMNYVMPGGNPDVAPYKSIPGSGTYCFDDVDDYNNYERTANTSDISGYHLKVKVYYISKNNPNVPIVAYGGQTYYKRIDVTVDHPLYLPNKLTFSATATY